MPCFAQVLRGVDFLPSVGGAGALEVGSGRLKASIKSALSCISSGSASGIAGVSNFVNGASKKKGWVDERRLLDDHEICDSSDESD